MSKYPQGDVIVTLRQFAANEVIIQENDPGEFAYIIEKGQVAISKVVGGQLVHIATLDKGAVFGEMSMIDDMPRSATVTAREETLVREIHRDDLYTTMKESPEVVLVILKRIFERLRESNMLLAQAKVGKVQDSVSQVETGFASAPVVEVPAPVGSRTVYSLEGLTPEARAAMPQNPFKFAAFPFKIGRKSRDPIVSNHLEIEDHAPLQISRHHVSIIKDGDRIGVVDRGSQLGASVDGVRIGGKASPGPVFLKGEDGVLVLGPESSPYRFKISTETVNG